MVGVECGVFCINCLGVLWLQIFVNVASDKKKCSCST